MDAATGCIAGPMVRLAEVFEACPSWFGATFHYNVISKDPENEKFTKDELEDLRPWILLSPDYPAGYTMTRDSSSGYSSSGVIRVSIERDADDLGECLDNDDLLRKWDNLMGSIFREFWEATENRMDVLTIDTIALGTNSDKDAKLDGKIVGATFRVTWGQQQ